MTVVELLLFAGITAAWLWAAGTALYNHRTAQRLSEAPPLLGRPSVSVLIPARNEAQNLLRHLGPFLRDLAATAPTKIEVIVLDDHSTDETAAVLEQLASNFAQLSVLRGAPLPSGWGGKNWACHQLAEAAHGEFLFFVDADVAVRLEPLLSTVAVMQHSGAGLGTAVLPQRTGTWFEHAVVPLVMHFVVLAWLPLRWVSRSRRSIFTLANGQWLAFRRHAYQKLGGHAAVRARVDEDMALGIAAKQTGIRIVAAIADRGPRVRMYRGAAAVRAGFSKNLYALLGGRPVTFGLTWLIWATALVGPWLGLLFGSTIWLLPVLLWMTAASSVARAMGRPVFDPIWWPVGSFLLLAIAMESAWRTYRGRLQWKGRTMPTEKWKRAHRSQPRPLPTMGGGTEKEKFDVAS